MKRSIQQTGYPKFLTDILNAQLGKTERPQSEQVAQWIITALKPITFIIAGASTSSYWAPALKRA